VNEQIKQLAEQAGIIPGIMGLNRFTHFDPEKFAELIVQECGVALSPMLRDMISRGQAVELIKKHFGVEL
jgi:hypothetical protein